MPLPTPKLDDRTFQQIVDQAKRLIPQYCPEWTDHNVSDPGVALIELFAWMTDMVLYRTNQVPDKMLVQFLELLGVHLNPQSSSQARITFFLTAAQEQELAIPEGTEVATVRTETSPAITFTTEQDFVIRPPQPLVAFQYLSEGSGATQWVGHDLLSLGFSNQTLPVFSTQPTTDDALYFAFSNNLSHHLLGLVLKCTEAGWTGIEPENPPWIWEAKTGPRLTDWEPCVVESDDTGGFNRDGEILLHLPNMYQAEVPGTDLNAYWVRVRIKNGEDGERLNFEASPQLHSASFEARGATVSARHATTVVGEYLGQSDGTPGQTFKLRFTPLLASDPKRDFLSVHPPGEELQQWQRVGDFANSDRDSPHYTLDVLDGTLTLGPALPQPDGSVYRFGRIPPKGSVLRMTRYQYGGGTQGNVPSKTLTVLKSSVPYIAQVTNREAAAGGLEAQSLEDAKVRLPDWLRTRHRAVTADDFEHLAERVDGVARACCLAPGEVGQDPDGPKPGEVVLVILPEVKTQGRQLQRQDFALSAQLHERVMNRMEGQCLLGTRLSVREAPVVWVAVQAEVRATSNNPAVHQELYDWVIAELNRYLDPFVGGKGEGWTFGRELHVAELYSLIQRNSRVDYIAKLKLAQVEMDGRAKGKIELDRIAVPKGGVVCPRDHVITVRSA